MSKEKVWLKSLKKVCGRYLYKMVIAVDPDLATPVSVKKALKMWLKSLKKVCGKYLYKMVMAVDPCVPAPVTPVTWL